MASRLRKSPRHSHNPSASESRGSSRTTPATPSFPRSSVGNLAVGASVLENKRRSMYDTLAVSADLLDTTRRQSRRSLLQNIGSTADLLDSTRRNISKGIKKSAEKFGLGKEQDYPSDDDKSFFCVGEKHDDPALEEPKWPLRSSLGWVVIGMLARRGELKKSVIGESALRGYKQPLPPHPEFDDEEQVNYRQST